MTAATMNKTNPKRGMAILVMAILALLWVAGQFLGSLPRPAARLSYRQIAGQQRDMTKEGLALASAGITPEEVESLKTPDIDHEAGHGDERHPYEAAETRRCLDNQGPSAMFKWGDLFMRVCDLGPHNGEPPDSNKRWFGVQVLVKDRGKWYELSAYCPKLSNKTFNGLLDWIYRKPWTRFGG